MVKTVVVEGFEAFMKLIESNGDKVVYVFFSGSKGQDGKSWCPDCVVAKPVVEKCVKEVGDDVMFVYCDVGSRDYWKDKNNEFRTHEKLRLTGVPTLLKWGAPRKLVEDDCAKEDLVAMFFEED